MNYDRRKTATRSTYKLFPRGSYLYTFFEEKDLPEKNFKVVDNRGVTHFIPNTVVIEHIAQTSSSERRKIEDVIRKIDFKNGDVNHFLEHLAGAIAEQYAGII